MTRLCFFCLRNFLAKIFVLLSLPFDLLTLVYYKPPGSLHTSVPWIRDRKSNLIKVLSVMPRKENTYSMGGILYITDLRLSTCHSDIPVTTL